MYALGWGLSNLYPMGSPSGGSWAGLAQIGPAHGPPDRRGRRRPSPAIPLVPKSETKQRKINVK
jgi:hypothetical protein